MKTLIRYAMSFIGKPYIWGAEGPTGFDCSGFVQELLRSCGEDPKGDQTALDLYKWFMKEGDKMGGCGPGVLVFYGKTFSTISHVAFGIDDFRVIEAGGGDSSCTGPADADRKSAMVRIRPFDHRSDVLCFYRPDYKRCKEEGE